MADICTYRPLVNRLHDPLEANLYVRYSERKDICLDMDAKLFDDSDGTKSSKLMLKTSRRDQFIDDSLYDAVILLLPSSLFLLMIVCSPFLTSVLSHRHLESLQLNSRGPFRTG